MDTLKITSRWISGPIGQSDPIMKFYNFRMIPIRRSWNLPPWLSQQILRFFKNRKLDFWCFHIVIHYSHSLLVCKTVFLRLKVIFIHQRPKLLSFIWTKDNISNVIFKVVYSFHLAQVIVSFKSTLKLFRLIFICSL